MACSRDRRIPPILAAGLAAVALGGCHAARTGPGMTTGSLASAKVVAAPTPADRDCLARAMYFESRRADEEGLLAVGTVVMNRLDAPAYPARLCEVVGQKRQFATGVLTKPVRDEDRPRIERVADALLAGHRHDKVGGALHFHTAGLTFPYGNMHYVAEAGGNVFYEKSDREGYLPAPRPRAVVHTARGPVPLHAIAHAAPSQGPAVPPPADARYAALDAAPVPALREAARDICRVADEA